MDSRWLSYAFPHAFLVEIILHAEVELATIVLVALLLEHRLHWRHTRHILPIRFANCR